MIGIQAAPISKAIHAGVLNREKTMFRATPQDVTGMALLAVADFTAQHYDGKAGFNLSDGTRVEIRVTQPSKETPDE